MLSRYDLKDTSKITLVDIELIAAMGPPGGGRNPVTPRFIRHFNICTINTFSDETMVRIFSSIVAFYFRTREFPPEYFLIGNQIVSGTMEVSKYVISNVLVYIPHLVLTLKKTPKNKKPFFLSCFGLKCQRNLSLENRNT